MSQLSYSFPVLKAEKLPDGRLLVEGIATSEAVDAQGDVMDFGGSKSAFARWRGNLREAHDPKKMVGKALDWWPVENAKQIGVRAFISAGAPDTQAKVLDGTLSMFSVGGDSKRTSVEKMGDRRVRRVLEWDMTELSLVDSGANPDAAFTIAKGDVAAEELAEEAVEKREFSDERRGELAEESKAMPDGSFPIVTAKDLHNAVAASGRAANPEAVKEHIRHRAKDLGIENELPEAWKDDAKKEGTMPEENGAPAVVAKAEDTGENVEKPFDHFAAVKHHEAEAEKADDPEAKKLHLAAAKAHEKAPDDPEAKAVAEEASKAAHEFKKSNCFADALLAALEKRKGAQPVVKCNKTAAMDHLERARDTIEKGWLEDKTVVEGELRKEYGEFMPTLSVPKMPEDDISFAITVLGTLRTARKWIDTLSAAEAQEMPPEPDDVAQLKAACDGVDAAIAALATFVGMEAAEIAEGKEATVLPALVKRHSRAVAAAVAAAFAAREEPVVKALAEIKTAIESPASEPETRLTKGDVASLADALGTVLGEEREKTSKVVGALLKQVESVGAAVADLLQKTVTVGEGVERILKAPVPGGPARFDVRKAATMSFDGATGVTGDDAEYAALLRAHDEATPATRAFIESKLLIAQAMRGQR